MEIEQYSTQPTACKSAFSIREEHKSGITEFEVHVHVCMMNTFRGMWWPNQQVLRLVGILKVK